MNKQPRLLNYVADVSDDIASFLQRWALLLDDESSPFHALPWMTAWYASFGSDPDVKPLLVGVRRDDSGADVMLLPLICTRQGGLSLVRFADATVIDYNSPLLAANWAGSAAGEEAMGACANRLWKAIRKALQDHDVLYLDKMLGQPLDESAQRVNPIMWALRRRLHDCDMFGNQFQVTDSWDDWRHSLDKRVRKEFERCWRVFTRSEQARFERVTDSQAALQLLEQLEHQQKLRMDRLSYDYVLDRPAYRAFYRQALAGGLADGSVVLTALRDGDDVVAAQLGIANRYRYIALRLSTGGDEWKTCSPGRLLCERTAQHLHEQGLRWFDFGIGDYRHKQMFQVSHMPLFDGCEALSWRGLPLTWAWRLRRALKRQSWLVARWRRLNAIQKLEV
jgi:CelD/BcsL family acetyltransferase involved in cellulose biosynthesis